MWRAEPFSHYALAMTKNSSQGGETWEQVAQGGGISTPGGV